MGQKKGIWERIKEKRAEQAEKQQQKKTLEFQKKLRENAEVMNKEYNQGIKRIVSQPCRFELTDMGVTGFFTMNDGTPIVSYTSLQLYEGTPRGAFLQKREVFPTVGVCATVTESSIPSSMFTKSIGKGFLKGSDRLFLPFSGFSPDFNARKLYDSRSGWDPLVEKLNQDKDLIKALNSLPNSVTFWLTHKEGRTYKFEDYRDKDYETICQVIPCGNETLTAVRFMAGSDLQKIQSVAVAISRVRTHIMNYGYTEQASGKIIQPWAPPMLALFKSKATEPAIAKCVKCGAPITGGAKYCQNCGQKLR